MKKLLSLAAMLFAAITMFAQDPIPVTCAEAKAKMPEANNGVTDETYIVTGYITNTNGTISREQQTFWMDDEPGSTKTIQGYWCNLPEGEKDIPLKVGDKITLTGKIMNYNGTAEIKNGDVAIIERAVEVPLDTISVSDALKRIEDNILGACFIKGKVTKILTKDADIEKYNNINYWLADIDNPNDSIQGYKMYGANNQKYNSAADIEFVESDEILVYASALQLYHNNNTNQDIPEINVGYYVRTLKSSVIDLPWKFGTVYRGEGEWTLEITKTNNDAQNVLEIAFASDKANSIKGSYSIEGALTIEGAKADVAGTASLEFKDVNADGINIYNVHIAIQTADKKYSIKQDIEIFAVDEEGEEIILDGDRPFKPTEEGQEITCAQAQEYAFTLAANTDSELSVVVVGYVTDIFTDGQSFWMADEKGSDKIIQAYKFKTLSPIGVGLQKGALVKVAGKITNFVNSNTGASTAEVKNGAVTIVEGGQELTITDVTVAEAIAIAEAMEPSTTTTDIYRIAGYITGIVDPYSEQYKNISFWIGDAVDDPEEFQVYHANCDASIVDKLVEGAHVIVIANIQHFHQDAKPATDEQEAKPERTIFEAVNGTVTLYGTAVDNIHTDVKAVKFIENGQIIIICNGVHYNLQGQIAQ